MGWIRAHDFWAIPCVAVVAFAVLVYLAFGVSHTRTVVKTRTVTVVKHSPPPVFNGSLSSLVAFLHPHGGKQIKCQGFPPDSACFQLTSTRWFIYFAAPSSAAAR